TRDYLLQSDWYQERLNIKQHRDCKLWQQHRDYILQQLSETEPTDLCHQLLTRKLSKTERMLADISQPSYLENLQGTLGADWVHREDS
ncbi:MAG: hypothetical protein RIR39_2679, partial [Pseudomonadota bacterium]